MSSILSPLLPPPTPGLCCFKGGQILFYGFNELLLLGFWIWCKIIWLIIFAKSSKLGSLVVSKIDKTSAMLFMNSCPSASESHVLSSPDLYTKFWMFSSKFDPPYNNKVSSSWDSFLFELFLSFLLDCFSPYVFFFFIFFLSDITLASGDSS